MRETTDDLSLRLRFRAVRANLNRVRAQVEVFLAGAASGAFSVEDVDEIVLALSECLSNAARHAAGDDDPVAHLFATVRDGVFHARLRDQGRPFDPAAIPDPDPHQPKEGGYGLFLLRHTMDDVRWYRRGRSNVVEFERRGSLRSLSRTPPGHGQVDPPAAPIDSQSAAPEART